MAADVRKPARNEWPANNEGSSPTRLSMSFDDIGNALINPQKGGPDRRFSSRCCIHACISRQRFGSNAACCVQRFWFGVASSLAFPPWRGCPGLVLPDRGLELLALGFLLVADFPKKGPFGSFAGRSPPEP